MTFPKALMLSLSVAASLVGSPVLAKTSVDWTLFDAAPVPARLLAASHGTSDGYRIDFATMVAERARVDQQTFAGINQVSMDAWWAYDGSILIASSLR